MTFAKNILLTLSAAALILCSSLPGAAQSIKKKQIMNYQVIGRDTVLVDEIPPAVIHPRQYMKKKEYKDFYRRLHNFSKAYPYALFVSKTINETEKLFAEKHYTKRQQEKYLNKMKSDLVKDFDPIFRQLTLKQGMMMIRLIDREVGLTPYYILKHYFNGITAGFWQGVARVCKGNLKEPYDKFGQDKDLEEFVQIWQRGEFDDYYIWIFGKQRPEIFIPERYR